MAQSEKIVDGFHVQSCLFNEADKVVGMVHLAVAVGNGCKIEADLRKTERGGVETLAIPERLHDVEMRVWGHHFGGTTQYAHNLLYFRNNNDWADDDEIYQTNTIKDFTFNVLAQDWSMKAMFVYNF